MKIVLKVDGRSYAGSPKDIVGKLRRDAIHMKTSNLEAYIEAVSARLRKDGWGEIEVRGDSADERCESLLVGLIACGFARPVPAAGQVDAAAIRVTRLARGLTQEALAAELGVAFSTVNRWENGSSNPTGTTARVLEEKLFGAFGTKSEARTPPPRGGVRSPPKSDAIHEAIDATRRALSEFEAQLAPAGTVVVPQGVTVRGGVTGESVTIEGNVEGIVEARESITLVRGCTVVGALRATRILIQDGAEFRGTITMDDDEHSEVPSGTRRASAHDFEEVKEKLQRSFVDVTAAV